MRYKPISFALAVLLIGAPVLAQEISPIVVETLRTANPTAVITGQPFTQTYVIRYIDLTDEGEEIVVQENELNPGVLGNFEVLNLEITKTTVQKQFFEHDWYLTYTLRVINPQKGPVVIPPLTVPWILKKVGQNITDPSLRVNTDFKTNPIHLSYVSTLPEKEPNLDIRDEINFGSYSNRAIRIRVLSWFLGIGPLLFFALLLVRNRISIKNNKESDSKTDTSETEDTNLSMLTFISRKKALRDLGRYLNHFDKLAGSLNDEDLFKTEVKISESLNDFLRAELSLNVGATPSDMAAHVEQKLKNGRSKKLLLRLTKTAVVLYQDVEKGRLSDNFVINIQDLRNVLKDMRWYSRLLSLVGRK